MMDGYNRVRFAEYEADLLSGEVFRNGIKVPIQEKPFQILRLLLRAGGAIITREQISTAVWPDTHVETSLSLNTAIRKLRSALRDDARNPRLIQTTKDGYRLLVEARLFRSGMAEGRSRIRLAVAPFENLGPESQEYLADGMTEEMISQLGRTHKEISIIAPFSMLCYKQRHREVAEIARELRADYVLTGSVTGTQGEMAVAAKLVRASDLACLWSDRYVRIDNDIFLIQDEITRNIADAILTVLKVPESRASNLSTDRWTHEKYLRGCYFANKWSEAGFRKAIELFQQAIEQDPNFAPAHAALAKLYMGMSAQGILPPDVLNAQTHAAASAALALCPDLPDAITALGWSQLFHDGDWRTAERSFLRSIEINPSATHAYEGYAHLLVAVRRYDEAIEVALRARDLDPLSPFSGNVLACTYYFAGQLEEARMYVLRCLEDHPAFPIAFSSLGWICEALGEMSHAVSAHRSSVEHNDENPAMLANLAHTLGVAGHHEEARQVLERVVAARQVMYVPPYWIALGYAGIGEHETALDWLEKGIDEHCGWRVFYGVDPKLESLTQCERFWAMLGRIGFPQQGRTPRTRAVRSSPASDRRPTPSRGH